MAIVSVELQEEGGRTGEQDSHNIRTYVDKFDVFSNSIFGDDQASILTNFAYPFPSGSNYPLGTAFPGDGTAYVIKRNAEYVQSAQLNTGVPVGRWTVTLEFGLWDPMTFIQNELDYPILPIIETQNFDFPADKDKDGNPIQNTAGVAYNPTIQIPLTHLILRCSVNMAAYPVALQSFLNYINNDSGGWQGFPQYSMKFNSMVVTTEVSQYLASTYFKVDLEFEFNPLTWLKILNNVGFTEKVNVLAAPVLRQIMIGSIATEEPMQLDINGKALLPPVTISNVIYNTFHVFQETSFASVFSFFPVDIFAPQTP